MDDRQRLVWSEGLFLTPHHFQQTGRYVDGSLRALRRALTPHSFGVIEIDVDRDALIGGSLQLRRCTCVMPDGTYVDVPETDAPPPARDLRTAIPAGSESTGVYLALPTYVAGQPSVSEAGELDGRATRFKHRHVTLEDETAIDNRRQLVAATQNLKLIIEGEPTDDYHLLKICEVGKSAAGDFEVKESFIPPALTTAASPRIAGMLRRVLEIMGSRAGEMSAQRRQRGEGMVEMTASDAAVFAFLQVVNRSLPILQHLAATPRSHPEDVYIELASLAGQLYTFASEGSPRDLVPYLHDDLAQTFGSLERTIQELLGTAIATRFVPIGLTRGRDGIFVGTLQDDRLLASGSFYLSVAANVPKEKLINEVPIKAKVSSRDRCERLISQALRGLTVSYEAVPPAEIPVQSNRTYFQIHPQGDHWQAVKDSHTIAVYLSPEFRDLQIEMMAIKESSK